MATIDWNKVKLTRGAALELGRREHRESVRERFLREQEERKWEMPALGDLILDERPKERRRGCATSIIRFIRHNHNDMIAMAYMDRRSDCPACNYVIKVKVTKDLMGMGFIPKTIIVVPETVDPTKLVKVVKRLVGDGEFKYHWMRQEDGVELYVNVEVDEFDLGEECASRDWLMGFYSCTTAMDGWSLLVGEMGKLFHPNQGHRYGHSHKATLALGDKLATKDTKKVHSEFGSVDTDWSDAPAGFLEAYNFHREFVDPDGQINPADYFKSMLKDWDLEIYAQDLESQGCCVKWGKSHTWFRAWRPGGLADVTAGE